ncbi:calcium-binding protein [Herbaspirillum sp. alder98]|uniref:calcium-binding protein n=1 Tax=Herbaspirillum sp. alder98 TaxID=2913096 RepID=UPI001CD8CC83|nr:calcium-binding protein [Herbaspirillum sp. alder98]MCA1323190.1 calcium-binding protein [Herbaspirillum sp. alder98]
MSENMEMTRSQLPVPMLEHQGRDLIVIPVTGKSMRVPNYFPDLGSDEIESMLLDINRNIPIDSHEYIKNIAHCTNGPNVVLGTDEQLIAIAGDGRDVLIGGADSDVLEGGAGDDYLYGGLGEGNDTLDGGEGSDFLVAESGKNILFGRGGNDMMIGGTGIDWIYGGPGDDYLVGNGGDDEYLFRKGDGHDVVDNRDENGNDTLHLVDVNIDQVWFRRVGDDLEVSLFETGDSVRLNAWYSTPAMRVDAIATMPVDGEQAGKRLSKDRVENLVQAMAAFTPPPLGSTALPASYQAILAPVLAESWHDGSAGGGH